MSAELAAAAIVAAIKYRLAEQADTPRLWRGKALHELGLELDDALAPFIELAKESE